MTGKQGWVYYKHALLPVTAPHMDADISQIRSGEIWKAYGGKAILARWTDRFDCGYATDWWYVIKDAPLDIDALPAKKRYKINRGKRYFDVRLIDPMEYKEALYALQVAAYGDYPAKYRPRVDRQELFAAMDAEWTKPNVKVYAAFYRETDVMAGYIQLKVNGRCIESVAQKANPAYEKFQVNYALLAAVLDAYRQRLTEGYYVCVGARNVQHETAFQDFVENIFGFRKAYCRLHIAYNPRHKALIQCLYPLRKFFRKMDGIRIVHKINGVLGMEEIVRKQNRRETSV